MALHATLPHLLRALNVDELYPPLSLSRSSFSEEIETSEESWGAASKLRHPFAPLLIVLLAVVIASSGILLARRKRREASPVSPVGEEERAVEAPAPAEAPPVSLVGEEKRAVESPAPAEAPLVSPVGEDERAVGSPPPGDAPLVSPVGEEERSVESPPPGEAFPVSPVGEDERAVGSPPPGDAPLVSPVREEERSVESPPSGEAPLVSPVGEDARAVESSPPAESPAPPSEAPVPSEKTAVEAEEPAPDKAQMKESKRPEAAPGAAVVGPQEDKRPEVGDEVSASLMRELEEEIIQEFERTHGGKAPEEVTPSYLGNFITALKQFRSFLLQYKADLEGGEEKDEVARQKRRRWTLYKMQMATVTEKETEALKQFNRMDLNEVEEREAKVKLQEVFRLRITSARMWMKLAAEDGLHPDSSKKETVLNLLKTQELHYWKFFNGLTGDVGLQAPEEAGLKFDTWSRVKTLCEKLDEEDYWLIYTVP
ncbi:hypothetical protein Emed_001951 [Eimeria media]